MKNLRKKLLALDGKGYKAYKDITGQYSYPDFELSIDHVQGDPFATPSRISVRINTDHAGFPDSLWQNNSRRIALEDYLGRAIKLAINKHVKGHRGSGGSGGQDGLQFRHKRETVEVTNGTFAQIIIRYVLHKC